MAVNAPSRAPWAGLFRPLERDERLFAVLLAFVMVGGLATLGLLPLRPRHRVDVFSVVIWFGLYKAGIFALVTVTPRATRRIFITALCIDLLLVFLLLFLTGGGDSPFVNLFFPLVAVNAYYFGRWVGLFLTLVAGLLYWAAASLAPPAAAWTAVVNLMAFVGLPAFAVGHVADRERRARSEVERLNAELTGTLTRPCTMSPSSSAFSPMAAMGLRTSCATFSDSRPTVAIRSASTSSSWAARRRVSVPVSSALSRSTSRRARRSRSATWPTAKAGSPTKAMRFTTAVHAAAGGARLAAAQ